jgi:ribosomal protein S19E (S16A)
MAYAESAVGHIPVVRERPARAKRNVFRRLFDAIEQANMQRAEREIARYLNNGGRKFTDEAEREIERRFLSQR